MKLSNELVYNGALQCGSDKVASSKLSVPNKVALKVLNSFQTPNVQFVLLFDFESIVKFRCVKYSHNF